MKRAAISLELLEPRIAPAQLHLVTAAYNAATGELDIGQSDDLSHHIQIFQTGANSYRVEGISTSINTGGQLSFDVGKLTKLNITGGAQADQVDLFNVRTLAALSFFGAAGDDTLNATNVSVKGDVELGGTGVDAATFDGLATAIGGRIRVQSGPAATDAVQLTLAADQTSVGSLDFQGGGGPSSLLASGSGAVTIPHGISYNAGTGVGALQLENAGALTIGYGASGAPNPSVLFIGSGNVDIRASMTKLAGGIEILGGGQGGRLQFFSPEGSVRIGKLASGDSIQYVGTAAGELISLGTSNMTLSGGINFDGVDGPDAIDSGIGMAGFSFGKNLLGESVSFSTAGTGRADLSAARVTLAGGVNVAVGGMSSSLSVTAFGGALTVGKLASGESIKMSGAGTVNTLEVGAGAVHLAGGLAFTATAGDNSLEVDATSGVSTVGKLSSGASITYRGAGGKDTLTTNSFSLGLAGGIDFDGGDGTNQVEFDGFSGVLRIGRLSTGQSLLVHGGSGLDDVVSGVAHLTLAGGVEDHAGDGAAGLTIDGAAKIGKYGAAQSVVLLGAPTATLNLTLNGNVTTTGVVEVVGGSGADMLTIEGTATLGKDADGVSLQFQGNDGDDLLQISTSHLTLAGALTMDGGNGNDTLDLETAGTVAIKGALLFSGEGDNNGCFIAAGSLLVAGNLEVHGGAGADSVSLLAAGSIGGDLLLTLGASTANESITLDSLNHLPGGLAVKGALTITSLATTTSVTLKVSNLSVTKAIGVTLGDGDDLVTIDNLIGGSTFRLDTAGGGDLVLIERKDLFGPSVFKGLATILLGAGDNDQLAVGLPHAAGGLVSSDSSVRFLGGLVADGGAGVGDARNDLAADNTFGIPFDVANITGFESTALN